MEPTPSGAANASAGGFGRNASSGGFGRSAILFQLPAGAESRGVHAGAVVALPVGTDEDGRLAGCRRWTRWRWRSRRCLSRPLKVPSHVLDRRADLLLKALLLVQARL